MMKPVPRGRGAGARRTADLQREIERLSARLEDAERTIREYRAGRRDGRSGLSPPHGDPGAPDPGRGPAPGRRAGAPAAPAGPDTFDGMESSLRERTRELTVMNREFLEEIRERFAVEEELRRSESRFRAIFELAPVGIALIDMRDRFVAANAALGRMLGVDAHGLRGRRIDEFLVPGEKFPRHRIYIDLVRRKRPAFDAETQWVGRDGAPAWARVRLSLFEPSQEGPPLFLCTAIDITSQKRFDAALRANVRRQSAVAEIGGRALRETDSAPLLQHAVTQAARVLRVPGAGMLELLPDGSSLVLRAGVGFAEGTVGAYRAKPGAGSQSGFTLLSRRPVVVEDLRAETRFRPSEMLLEHGARSGMSVPILGGEGEPLGVLGVYDTKPRRFGTGDVAFVEAVANILGLFLERTRIGEELSRAQAKFRTLVEQTPAVTYVAAPDDSGTALYVSPQIRALGYSPEEWVGDPALFLDRLHPEDRPRVLEEFGRCRASGRAFRSEYRLASRDGRLVWFRDDAVPVREDSGAIAYWQGVLLDISDRKEAERELAATTELLGEVFSNIHILIAYLDTQMRFIRVNEAYARAGGHPPEYFVGKGHFELYPHGENEAIFRRVLATGEPVTFLAKPYEYPGDPGRGTTYWDWSLQPVRGRDGSVTGLVLSLLDVTERKRAEEEVRQSEARFRALVEALPVAICVVQDGRIAFRNREQEITFGAAPPGARLRDALSVHPEDAGALDEFFAAMDAGEAFSPPSQFRIHPAGAPGTKKARWVLCRASPILHEGKPAHLVCAIDITRAKELEQLVLVREKLASLGVIAAGVAHEIRNPLSGMNIYVSALHHLCDSSADLDPATRDKVQVIADQLGSASDKISSVIRGIMDFSRPASLALTRLDLNNAAEEAVRLCAATIRLKKVELVTSLSPDLPACRGDRLLIGQVLVNLITNALQAMESVAAPKRLKVATSEEEGMVCIKVSDSGEGIAPHLREQIFDPFFTTRKEGYGIGLSFCRRVVEDHRGILRVDTSEWGGAEFGVALPLEKEGPA